MSIQEHLSILLNLPEKEREEISRELWKSLDKNNLDMGTSEYEKSILQAREKQFKYGETTEDSWENVKSRLIEKINKV
ncbi:MAG: hypothetical protein JXQ87_14770 [Bacteroidia bacterium]